MSRTERRPGTSPNLDQTADTVVPGASAPTRPPRPHLPAGTHVGRYVTSDIVGAGGMGTVYKAFDAELNRTIALKIIHDEHAGAGSSQTAGRERLLREAQALACLSHPNVLPVYDVGTYHSDVFIATEFVAGRTVRQWASERPRRPDEVLAVFLAAGQGLVAAHRAGLVHRDFKPDNVMIGDDGRIRVLDFGLVRASHGRSGPGERGGPVGRDSAAERERAERAERPTPVEGVDTAASATRSRPPEGIATSAAPRLLAPLTVQGSIMGTPRYMSPEQHRGDDVDARSDQFSFCVALYEVLYGRAPFPAAGLDELRARVLAGGVAEPGRHRGVPRRLWPLLRRGLAVDPAARHPSLEALLAELGRPPWLTAHRAAVVAGIALAVAATTAVGVQRSRQRERAICGGAEAKLTGIWDAPRRAAVRAAFAATGAPYAADAFARVAQRFDDYAQGWVAMRRDGCADTGLRGRQSGELLDLRMQCLDERLNGLAAQVDVFASADAKVVERAGAAAQSLAPLAGCADAAALRTQVRQPADDATRAAVAALRKRVALANAEQATGRVPEALATATAAARDATALAYRPVEAEALLALGNAQSAGGDPGAAVASLHQAARAADAGRADETRADALVTLVRVVGEEQGHYDDAWTDAREAQAMIERIGHADVLQARLWRNTGILAWRQGKIDDALVTLLRALDLREKTLGTSHRETAESLSDLADALVDKAELDKALALYDRALGIWRIMLGPDHPEVAVALNNMANVLAQQGKLDEALQRFGRARDIWERALGPTHPKVGMVVNNIGDAYSRLHRYRDALDCYRRALPIFEKAFGPLHFTVGVVLGNIGEAQAGLGDLDGALASYERARTVREQALGREHPEVAAVLADEGDVFRRQRRHTAALAAYRRGLAMLEKALGPQHPDAARPLVGIGEVYLAEQTPAQAVAPFERALALAEAHPGDGSALGAARFGLAQALWAGGGDAQRRRAATLAADARTTYAAAGGRERERLDAVDAWLARHRGSEAYR